MNPRLAQVLQKIKSSRLDGFLVNKAVNVSYLTDFPALESWLLVHPKQTFYLTDFRYIEEAKKGLSGIYLKKIKAPISKDIYEVCKELGIKRLGIESKSITLAEYEKLKDAFKSRIEIVGVTDIVESLRQIKTPEEIQKIKQAIEIAAEAFKFLRAFIKPGLAEFDAAIAVEYFIKKRGASLAFNTIVASGTNSVFPHARITKRKFQLNEPVTIDLGVDFEGYKSDLTRVLFLGKIPPKVKQVYSIVLASQNRAIQKIKSGAPACEIDGQARKYIEKHKLGQFFGHSLGHGVGREVHESPSISSRSDSKLEKNMVFTVEPAVYLPGEFGIRIEDIVLVKEKGCEVLSGFIN